MAYRYSVGKRQFGDIKAENDAQGDTLIDFEEDQIEFQTSGSVRLQINNDHLSSSLPLSASSIHFADGVKIAGAPAGQDTVIDNQGNFYGNTINVGTVSSSNIVVTNENGPVYQLPLADGTSGQAITTDGAGNLTFSTISGGGGGGSTSPAGSNTEIQYNNNGVLGASSNLTYDGTRLKVDGNLQLDGEIIHNNYSKISYPSNLTNTGSYADKKSFVKEFMYAKYDWLKAPNVIDLFSIEPYDERTGQPYSGTNLWAAVGAEITVLGHYKGAPQGNLFMKLMYLFHWAGGSRQTPIINEMVAGNSSADSWFLTANTGSLGTTLRFQYNGNSRDGWNDGPGMIHIKVHTGYSADDQSVGYDGKYIYWVLTEHFNEPSE
jgi:hypothetical protein